MSPPDSAQLLARDLMRIGVPTCSIELPIREVAAQMLELGCTALVVLDEDGGARGWINEKMLTAAFVRARMRASATAIAADAPNRVLAGDVMDDQVPEGASDIPLVAAIQRMGDLGVDHLFFMHRGGGRWWPASVLSLRDVLRALAGEPYLSRPGAAAPRPSPMDLFRQRHGLPTTPGT